MDIHDLVGAYVIDALDTEEKRDFEAHLAGCERCRAELRTYSGMVEALVEAQDDAAAGPLPGVATVPEGLAARIGAQVAGTPQEPAPASAGSAGAGSSSAGSSSVESLDDARRRRRTLPRFVAIAASLVLVAAFGIVAVLQLSGTTTDPISDFDRIRFAADREDLPLTVGDATVWISRAVGGQDADGIAIDGALPDLPGDQTYQVWIVPADGSAPEPGPVLRPTPDGVYAGAWVTSLADAAAIAISVEPWDPALPEQGSTTPTEVVDAVTVA